MSHPFDIFTDRARKVCGLARQAAQRFNHDYIGTEHMLIGLVQEGSGVAASVMANLSVNTAAILAHVGELVSHGTTMVTMGQLPWTPRCKKVLERSLEEARNLGHTYVGTEHLMLAIAYEKEGIAAQVLRNLHINPDDIHRQILELLGHGEEDEDVVIDIDERLTDIDERLTNIEKRLGQIIADIKTLRIRTA